MATVKRVCAAARGDFPGNRAGWRGGQGNRV